MAMLDRITAVESCSPTSTSALGRPPLRQLLKKLSSCVSTGFRSSSSVITPLVYSQRCANFFSRASIVEERQVRVRRNGAVEQLLLVRVLVDELDVVENVAPVLPSIEAPNAE